MKARRPAVAAAAAALALALLASSLAAAQGRRLLEDGGDAQELWDVIVVVAGMAGVTAARNLTDAGYRVLVLEGRERSAGRLNSTAPSAAPGSAVDLGAMWIHDAVPGRNALFDLVLRLGLPVSPRQDYNSIATYSYSGQRQSRMAYASVLAPWYSQLVPELNRLRGAAPADDRSVADVYSRWLAATPSLSASDKGQANLILHTNYQSLLNGNVTQLSAARLGDAKSIPAVDVMLRDGFQAVTDALKAGLDIRYSAVVVSVEQDGAGVTVTTADGANYTAPFALLTPSLGVLKAGDIAFDPPLPQDKLGAIEEMGFGVLDKTILVYDKPFWDTSVDFILREMPDLSGRYSIYLNYYKLFGWPILAAIHVADTAKALEGLTDGQVVGEGAAVLKKMYPGAPDPVQSAFTRWHADPFSKGSYSYFAVGNRKNITAALAEPVGRVLFGGEHTSERPATVLGAHLSGLREAARLQRLLGAPATAN